MTDTGQRQLISSKVQRYKNSGKLVVHGGYGFYLDLDKSLNFTSNNPHKINPSTELEETEWCVELEREGTIQNMRWHYVRAFSVNEKSGNDIADTSIPLEDRINISPSEFFNVEEQLYAKEYKSAGSWKTRLFVTLIVGVLALYINQTFGSIVFLIGLFLTVKQLTIEKKEKAKVALFNQGVDKRKNEILEAKKRVRLARISKLDEILSDFAKWQQMDGQSFEIATAKLFKKMGYSIEYTPTSNDGGIDLVLEKGTERVGVQCKAYSKNVGVAAIRELHGIKSQWSDLNKFILVGLHGFTKQAKEFASQHNVELFSIERDHFGIG